MTEPVFTVVMATWNRGRHVLPSVRSVLAQEFADFELLVIGDACTDDTSEVIASVQDPRVRWINLETRWRSQSGPNNRGNEEARGRYVAYLGHDDIWAPNHLPEVFRTFQDGNPDLVTSGLLVHAPPPADKVDLFGIGPPERLATVMTPPSGLAHQRRVWTEIGDWRPRNQGRGPVDLDFELRAAEAGLTFHSTGVVTVHKFAASRRYLCALLPSSDEQEAMLARVLQSDRIDRKRWLDDLVSRARRMEINLHRLGTEAVRLSSIKNNDLNRGIAAAHLQPLGTGITIRQDTGRRVGQWHKLKFKDMGFRYTCAGIKANLLVPVSADAPVRLELDLVFPRRGRPDGFALSLNGRPLAVTLLRRPGFWRNAWRATATDILNPDTPSVLTLTPPPHLARDDKGVGVGALRLKPY